MHSPVVVSALVLVIITIFVWSHKVVISEVLGSGTVLLRRGKKESRGEEEFRKPRLKHSNRVTFENSFQQ